MRRRKVYDSCKYENLGGIDYDKEQNSINIIRYNDIANPISGSDLTICNIEDLEIILNLIKKQQAELEKKDNLIDLMTEYVDFDKMDFQCSSLCVKEKCQKEWIKQYFEKQVEKE